MNNGITINLPSINWPFVVLVLILVWLFGFGGWKHFVKPSKRKRGTAPKKKKRKAPPAGKAPMQRTFTTGKPRPTLHVTVDRTDSNNSN